jgi:opacity protein-like surface antigen
MMREFFNHGNKHMKRTFVLTLSAAALLANSHAMANDFEAALTTETAQITFRSDSSLIGWGGSELAVGLFYNDDNDILGQFGLFQRRQASKDNPLTLGVGVRAYLGTLENINQDVAALAIGGEVRYTIPGTMPMALYLTGHYAPKITSFSDAEQVTDLNVGFQIEILPQTTAFAGFRSLEVDPKNSNRTAELDDDHLHVGIRLSF